MDQNEIDAIASEVRAMMNQHSPPIDVLEVARQEGVLLAPGNYGDEFDGRIEFHPKHAKFILFYPHPKDAAYPTRIRFSISHELGHFYLPEHRRLLLAGRSHYSQTGFVSDNALEKEADFFAASLLIPTDVLQKFCAKKEFYTLKELIALGNLWQTSVTSAAIRYTQWASECCAVVLSRNKRVIFYIPSDDAGYRGFQWLGKQEVAPRSATIEAHNHQGTGRVFEQSSRTDMWFSDRRASVKLWEEAFPLGYTGLVLTTLTLEMDD